MSMGAPLASLAAYHLYSTGHTANGIITFGSPRLGNLKLVEAINGKYLDDGVGAIGIAYMRDPVPHLPPRSFGYRSAQGTLFHISIDPQASVSAELGESASLSDFVRHSQTYESNSNNGWLGDKQFAGATYTFKITDHFGYFLSTVNMDLASCGM